MTTILEDLSFNDFSFNQINQGIYNFSNNFNTSYAISIALKWENTWNENVTINLQSPDGSNVELFSGAYSNGGSIIFTDKTNDISDDNYNLVIKYLVSSTVEK